MYKQIQRYLILAAGIITAGSLAAPAQAQYYKGKTITLLVGYSPGSGVTLSGRTFAPYWEKAIPGNPTVIVKNLTGGGGSKAQNFIYEKARPDGLTIYWGPTAMLGQIVGSPGIRARYDKLPFIGGSGRTLINYVATKPTNGLKKASDIAKVSKPLRLACTRSTSNFCILHRMAFDLLGVPYRIVAGFRGSEQFVKAMLQDEIDSHTTPDHSWNTGIGPNVKRDGKGKGVFFYPRIDANGNPEPLKAT